MGSQVAAREATNICEAGEIIRTLTPPRLATLSELKKGHETQLEVASALDRSSSLISKHLSALEELPIAIVNKADLGITDGGNELFGQLKAMARRLDVEFETTDFQEDTTAVEYCLSPLFAARGPLLFLVFHSIGVNNSVGNRIDLLKQENIQTASVVSDVENRQQNRGERVRRKQVRWQLKQLAKADSIHFENERISLSEKGEVQLRFFEQVIRIVEKEYNDEHEPIADSAPEELIARDGNRERGIAVNLEIETEQLSVMPELHLEGDVIALSDGMTVAEFVEQAVRLSEQHDDDSTLRLQWMLRSQTDESDILVD